MSNVKEIKKFKLAGTESGMISVANVSNPYGEGSSDVVSIAVELDGKNVDYKTHIPYENIDELIEALQIAKKQK